GVDSVPQEQIKSNSIQFNELNHNASTTRWGLFGVDLLGERWAYASSMNDFVHRGVTSKSQINDQKLSQ
ncbi:MAG: hypothetical protein CL862_00655, partial [Cyanobium sp. NAT70]|nr:hypothetical protein [Cyanobium sp. NAT70]